VLEFPFDTTRTITALIYGGVTVRYPQIRFICSHGGGTAPYLSGRIDGAIRMNPQLSQLLPDGALPELKKFYWDTALTFNEPAIRALLALTDVSRILFGSDFPFAPITAIPMGLKSLETQLPAADLAAILGGSARTLLPVLPPAQGLPLNGRN